jgi:hypothetical protein
MIITNVSIIGWIYNIDHTDVLIIGYIYNAYMYTLLVDCIYIRHL